MVPTRVNPRQLAAISIDYESSLLVTFGCRVIDSLIDSRLPLTFNSVWGNYFRLRRKRDEMRRFAETVAPTMSFRGHAPALSSEVSLKGA
jgi:hypothetical protein